MLLNGSDARRIRPQARFEGEFDLPGDKSITHRAIMLNAGAEGTATIAHALMGGDCLSTCQCMRALGAEIDIDGDTLCVHGTPRFRTGVNLNCGNSGTTMRLLTGFCAGKGIEAKLFGDESLSARPMARVASPLSLLGADLPAPLHGAEVRLSVASAQVKSAVLLAGISAEGRTVVVEPQKARDHTERLLAAMGADIRTDGNRTEVGKSRLRAVDVCVPSDISSAAYFMALGALRGRTLCKNVGLNPTRTGILTAFDRLGVKYSVLNRRVSGGEETGDILVEKSPMQGIVLTAEDVPSMIDELPLVALLCAYADGESRISGAGELRVKESDRIRTVCELIAALGGICIETEDGFIIRGKKSLPGGDVDSYLDHRIAMTAAVGLTASEKGGNIRGAGCCAISFPGFFRMLEGAEKGAGEGA